MRAPCEGVKLPNGLGGAKALYSSIRSMKKEFSGTMGRPDRCDVHDRLVKPGMGVELKLAVAARPPPVVLFDNSEEQCHRATVAP
jgi:hypothetical protein